jgi:hypothetical protein
MGQIRQASRFFTENLKEMSHLGYCRDGRIILKQSLNNMVLGCRINSSGNDTEE